MSRKLWIPIAAVAALVVLGSAGAYVYFFSGLRTSPASLALSSPSASSTAPPTGSTTATGGTGTWQIGSGSLVGYRVKEQFAGQASTHEAVARTGDVTGQVTITSSGGTYQMTSAKVTVQLSNLASVDQVAGYNVTNVGSRGTNVTLVPNGPGFRARSSRRRRASAGPTSDGR